MENILENLKVFNLTESEARVYLTLVQNGPQNGYETSKNSGIARTKIYAILENLVIKGFALSNLTESSKVYIATPIEEILEVKRNEFHHTASNLKDEITNLTVKVRVDYLFEINNKDQIIEKCISMIKEAQKQIYIQIFYEDVHYFEELLKEKEKENVEVILIYFSEKAKIIPIKNTIHHAYIDGKIEDLGGRFINITIDSKESLFSLFSSRENKAIWTQNKNYVFLSKEYFKHDVYCLRLIEAAKLVNSDILRERIESIRNIIDNH